MSSEISPRSETAENAERRDAASTRSAKTHTASSTPSPSRCTDLADRREEPKRVQTGRVRRTRGGGGEGVLIRFVADAVVARGGRVHVAVRTAVLLRRLETVGTEDVVHSFALRMIGC